MSEKRKFVERKHDSGPQKGARPSLDSVVAEHRTEAMKCIRGIMEDQHTASELNERKKELQRMMIRLWQSISTTMTKVHSIENEIAYLDYRVKTLAKKEAESKARKMINEMGNGEDVKIPPRPPVEKRREVKAPAVPEPVKE